MGTGQKVAVTGLAVLLVGVIAYYALQPPPEAVDIEVTVNDANPNPLLPDPVAMDRQIIDDPTFTQPEDVTPGVSQTGSASQSTSTPTNTPPVHDPSDINQTIVNGSTSPPSSEVDTLVQTTLGDGINTNPGTNEDAISVGPGGDDVVSDHDAAGEPATETHLPDQSDNDVAAVDYTGANTRVQTFDNEATEGRPDADTMIRIDTELMPAGDAGEDADDDLQRYTVVQGDSMWVIARKTLGAGAKHELIARANPHVDPNRIKPGDVLLIPKVEPERGPVAEITPEDPLGLGFNRDQRVIEVLEGDSLWKIAAREYQDGSKWQIIYVANQTRMKNENDLRVGQKLVIPPLPRE